VFLYRGTPGGVAPPNGVAGVPPPNGGSFALVSAPGAMPPPAEGGASVSWGLVNWHSLVLVFSYKVRPSGNCVVFHRGGTVAGGGGTPATPGATPLSAYSVIIIIATDAVAQFTMEEPVQNADDMLPLTSSAILIRFPVGVMF